MAMVNTLAPVLILAYVVFVCNGNYVITTPKQWLPGADMQVCVQVDSPDAPKGNLNVSIYYTTTGRNYFRSKRQVIFPDEMIKVHTLRPTSIQVPAGNQHMCHNVYVPELNYKNYNQHYISVDGYVDGTNVNHTGKVQWLPTIKKVITQTDKYLYKPGQMVQFRVLTHTGPLMEIVTDPYEEIYISTPSKNRISQWTNVDNSNGLIHLSMQLADEPEMGTYTIYVRHSIGAAKITSFKVEEYVLPRFEVKVEAPKYVLGTDREVSFTACAKYTFGEPVKGNVSWQIDNGQNYDCRVMYTKNDTISGCSELTVMSSDLKMIDCTVYNIIAEATVTEDGTGAQESGKGQVAVSRKAVTFKVIKQDNFMKPNLPYTLVVYAHLPDGSPASGELVEVCHGSSCNNVTTPANGIFQYYLTNRDSNRVVIQALVTRATMQLSSFSTTVKKFFSPSNSSLLISATDKTLKCVAGNHTNYSLSVLSASVGHQVVTVNVEVTGRGQVQYWNSQQYDLSQGKLVLEEENFLESLVPTSPDVVTGTLIIPLTLPLQASPKIRVLVWYIRDDGEVVSDLKELTVEKCLPNRVDLSWSTNKTEPGQSASLTIASAPSSLCSLGVVDKSVELLSPPDRKITIDSFFLNDYQYNVKPWQHRQAVDREYCKKKLQTEIMENDRYSYLSNFVDAMHIFDESGRYVFSNLDLQTRPCYKQRFNRPQSGGGLIDIRIGGSSGGSANKESGNVRITGGSNSPTDTADSEPRTDFPETWLWDLLLVPSSGKVNQDLVLPDTITEWVGKAVCVHPQKGVGLSERTSITTFTPFFVDLTIPASIKRGEILPVKISVFNYLQQSLPVRIILEASPEYDIVMENQEGGTAGERMSCIDAQEKAVHTVKIQPSVIGQVNITVTAFVDSGISLACGAQTNLINKRDALVRPITVEAEGFLREKSWSKYICADEVAAGDDVLETTELSVPQGMVEGSERAWVTAVGDLLAISLENIESLIRMPYGCGEQNMLRFVPNIFILKYLKITGQETPEATNKLLNYMRTGYQRQLLYRHRNGSYSAFGSADTSGSTWLTAFVLKSFAQAKQFILIDENSFNQTQRWLIDSYGSSDDLCVTTIGKVFNKGMKGGLGSKGNSPIPMTAYVLISLLESEVSPSNDVIRKALQCIKSGKSGQSEDSYTLAIKAYALALAKDVSAKEIITQLLQQAVILKNSTHWELPKGSGSKSLEVETAGYAILAMMAHDSTLYEQDARKVVKWISAQRNGRGGFYSTQDTVIALQALANYESTQFQGVLDMNVVAETHDVSHTFIVNESNKLVQQRSSTLSVPANLTYTISGQGCVVIQTVLRYNDPNAEASDAFSLRVNSETEPDIYCVTKRMSVCATYLLPDGISNMAVMEINLVSGYIPEKADLKKILKDNEGVIKRYDIDGGKLSFYIEEFTTDDVCVNFRVIRQVDVENVKPGTVVVYDYYQPEFSVSKTYNLPDARRCY